MTNGQTVMARLLAPGREYARLSGDAQDVVTLASAGHFDLMPAWMRVEAGRRAVRDALHYLDWLTDHVAEWDDAGPVAVVAVALRAAVNKEQQA